MRLVGWNSNQMVGKGHDSLLRVQPQGVSFLGDPPKLWFPVGSPLTPQKWGTLKKDTHPYSSLLKVVSPENFRVSAFFEVAPSFWDNEREVEQRFLWATKGPLVWFLFGGVHRAQLSSEEKSVAPCGCCVKMARRAQKWYRTPPPQMPSLGRRIKVMSS